MSQRIIGGGEAQRFFRLAAAGQGKTGFLPDVTPEFMEALERELSGSVGAATAHAMIGQLTKGAGVSVEDLIAVADEAAQILEYSNQLEAKSAEQDRTARALRDANEKLTVLSVQKDAFLTQISHELRTPMTSIRSFSEILRDAASLGPQDKTRYASIIHSETIRLTRLLDDLLDLSVLENGRVSLNAERVNLHDVMERAVITAQASGGRSLEVERNPHAEDIALLTDGDRLAQVFINIVSNAIKYCDAEPAVLKIDVRELGDEVIIGFRDNGSGIPLDAQNLIFEKFARLNKSEASGAGLGLAICREIIARLGGDITYVDQIDGGRFDVRLPRAATFAKLGQLRSA